MNKYIKTILYSIAFFILCFFIGFTNVNANDKSFDGNCSGKCNFYRNTLKSSEYNNQYSLNTREDSVFNFDGFNEWFNNESTFVLVQQFDSGGEYIWWNVPNTQQWIKNHVYQIFPTGWSGSGIEIQDKNAKTAAQKWGWKLPEVSYLGETPYITFDLVAAVIPDNPLGWIGRFFKWVFTGEILDAPGSEDMKTLHYTNVSDYYPDPYSLEQWIKLNWRKLMDQKDNWNYNNGKNSDMEKGDKLLNPGRCLYWGADKKCTVDGNIYNRYTVITDKGLDNFSKYNPEERPAEIIQALQQNLGENFKPVVQGILAEANTYAKKGYISLDFADSYARVMPYDISSMYSSDKEAIKIADPRSEYQNTGSLGGILGFVNKLLSITRKASVWFSNKIISFGGFLSKLSAQVASSCSFEVLDNMGLSPVSLWKSPILRILIDIIGTIFVIKLASGAIKLANGNGSLGKIIVEFFTMFIILGIFVAININVDKTWNAMKKVSSYVFDWGESSLSINNDLKPFYGTATSPNELRETTYWLPYFNLWTEYNVGYSLLDDENKIKDGVSEPEQVHRGTYWKLEKINGGQDIPYWSVSLLGAFDDGSKLDKSAYRVVDHFMAPRVSYNWSNKETDGKSIISVTQNENYNGDFQNSADWGILAMIILIFFCTLFKFFLFINCWFEIYTFIANCAMASISHRDIREHALRMGFSILAVGLWGLYLSLLIYLSLLLSGIGSIVMTIFLGWATWKILNKWIKEGKGSRIEIRLFSALTNKIDQLGGI